MERAHDLDRLAAVVLAAGEGTRMRSSTPKVLHPLCGRPMLLHVLDALVALPLERIVVVVGHGAEQVTKTLQEQLATEIPIEFVEQRVPAGHRRRRQRRRSPRSPTTSTREDDLIVVPGDTPLLRAETLAELATEHRHADAAATLLTARARTTRPATAASSATRRAGSSASSSRPTPPTTSSRSTRSTRRSTASAGVSSRPRCGGSAPRTPRASTT